MRLIVSYGVNWQISSKDLQCSISASIAFGCYFKAVYGDAELTVGIGRVAEGALHPNDYLSVFERYLTLKEEA